ncbi:MAG TPA: M20 family metallopeptidase [Candidatus Bathyarchaeia archaeon]|nr:M20 family metallopeptidase [Candidatus Bathyarchaeia archaeon]
MTAGQQIELLKERACARVEEERSRLVDLSLRIHGAPELQFEEHRASAWLVDYLESVGFSVERGAFGLPTAFAARLGSGHPRVAVLCEYDALPGIGHACGHNIIAAAGAGAGAALGRMVHEAGGSVVVLGTPAEEGGGGKILMAREGAFDGIDAAMMVHPAGMDLAEMHVLAVSQLEVEYHGKAAHASAFPQRGVNALDAMVTAYSAIAQLRQHIRPSERIHGIITDGGLAPNIVPERSAGIFYVRAANMRHLERLKKRVTSCFEAGALATGAELALKTVVPDYSDMDSNGPLADAYAANVERLGRKIVKSLGNDRGVSGSTDMGNVSKLVPSIHPMIAASPPGVALHSVEFAEWTGSEDGNRAAIDGAKALAMTAVDVLCNPDLLVAARGVFAARAAEARPEESR